MLHGKVESFNNLKYDDSNDNDNIFLSDNRITKKRERQLRSKPGWYRKRSSHLSKAQKRAINELGPLYSYRYRYNETITMEQIFGQTTSSSSIISKIDRSKEDGKLNEKEEDQKKKEENMMNCKYIMEIGFGTGHSLIDFALSNSVSTKKSLSTDIGIVPEISVPSPSPSSPSTLIDKKFLGIEWFRAGFATCLSLIKQYQLNNIRLIQGDAYEVLKLMKDNQLDEILIFFPDPWPNESDQDRRIIRHATLHEIYRVLKPKGQLHIATDVQQYAEWTAGLLASMQNEFSSFSSSPSLKSSSSEKPQERKLYYGELCERPICRPKTKYEMKALEQDPEHKIYDLLYFVRK